MRFQEICRSVFLVVGLSSCAAEHCTIPKTVVPTEESRHAASVVSGPLIPYAQFRAEQGPTPESSRANLWLWKASNGSLVGVFRAYDQEADSSAEASLDSVQLEGNQVAFDYRLKTLGPGGSVYWSDLCSFSGTLRGDSLTAQISGGCVEKPFALQMEKVKTRGEAKGESFFKKYASMSEWERTNLD